MAVYVLCEFVVSTREEGGKQEIGERGVDPDAKVKGVIRYANSLCFAGYRVACRVESRIRSEIETEKERIRDRAGANCSNQRFGRVSRTEERKMIYIRDATTGYIYRRGTIEHYIVAETKTNKKIGRAS